MLNAEANAFTDAISTGMIKKNPGSYWDLYYWKNNNRTWDDSLLPEYAKAKVNQKIEIIKETKWLFWEIYKSKDTQWSQLYSDAPIRKTATKRSNTGS